MHSRTWILTAALMCAACAPALQPLPPMAPLPEPPAESPLPGANYPSPPTGRDGALDVLRARGLMVPVAGVSPAALSDSYDAPRDGGRRHEAIDILAPRGTPVLAADDGVIVRVGSNALGGKVVWATDAGQLFAYYYAHLDHYARGLHEGQSVKRGAVIGYVGTTGNAAPGTPHLHFQMMRTLDAKRFNGGTPLNPLPYLLTPGMAAGGAP
jgi:murein DD-endopeptidase MepM/ murein hydrolase activator NlpD